MCVYMAGWSQLLINMMEMCSVVSDGVEGGMDGDGLGGDMKPIERGSVPHLNPSPWKLDDTLS